MAVNPKPKSTDTRVSSKRLIPRTASAETATGVSHWASNYGGIYRSGLTGRINMIRKGVSPTEINDLVARLRIQKKDLLEALNISQSTLNRKATAERVLSSSDSERVLGVAKLVGKVEAMMVESSDVKDFDAGEWVGRWLLRPNRALGNEKPIAYLDTVEGQMHLLDLLGQQQSGAYA